MIVGVDFDGTCVTNSFPSVGRNIGAAPVLRLLKSKGVKLMMWTIRGNTNSDYNGQRYPFVMLSEVKRWAKQNRVEFDSWNETPVEGGQLWTDSPKQFADILIDDFALGAPVIDSEQCGRFIDWAEVLKIFYNKSEIRISKEEYDKVLKEIKLERDFV